MKENVAVVVTYNRKELLRECLEALLCQNYENLDIILVDNNSNDGTYDFNSDLINNSRICYIKLDRNIGGAGGFSYGIKKAVENGYEYIWIMDDDTVPDVNALKELVIARKVLRDEFGLLASYVKWTDGNYCKMNAAFPYDWWVDSERFLKNGLLRIKSASFVSIYVKADVIKKVGLPIKEFFVWGDDIEFTTRISKSYPCFFCDNSIVVHKTKTNIGADIYKDDDSRLKKYEYLTRNDFYVAKRKGIGSGIKYFIRMLITIVSVFYKSPNHRWKKSLVLIKGLFKGLFFNPQIEYCSDKLK